MCLRRALYFLILVFIVDSARVRHHSTGKQALKFLKGIGVHNKRITSANGGLWPSVFNLATKALISVNATCGEGGREEFCRMSEGSRGRCGICDNFSPDPGKRHPINYAIDDGTNRWWQSPALYYGSQYEHVTITLDLKQVYQVAYVIIKTANSPRPGAWILERSIDGENYDAWQYFATSDKDCLDRYGIPARKGKPHYFTDSEVICTSFYSKLMPMENGEIHTFLIHGRPGANETSPELLQFTKARYVRLRLQGLRGRVEPLPAWLSQDIAKDKRLYYSIRDISIGGQCVCNGHASSCRHNVASGHPECECAHHTCGPNCEKCCPLFNQRHWGSASSRDSRICLPCNCHGHAKSCHYDEDVDRSGLSLDINGYYQGGGVCDNCTKHTMGINCEKCLNGYYRPIGTKPDADVPCIKCDCDAAGSTGHCDFDGSYLRCKCNLGYTGLRCDECADGYRGYPFCEACPCDLRGVLSKDCEGECVCKANVDGKFCNHCKPGYFSLQADNPEGCSACYCSGATTVCESAHLLPKTFAAEDGWLISDISVTEIEEPTLDERNMISVGNYEIPGIEAYYWLAPKLYLGNKLETYGSELIFKVHWVVMRGDTSGKPTTGPNIIMVGANGMRIASGDDLITGTNATFNIKLAEYDRSWYHVPGDVKDIITRLRRNEYKGEPVTRAQFLSVLNNIKHILLRAKYHTDQIECSLEETVMHSGNFKEGYSAVEECSCPSGYTGLSCESCQYGYVRIFSNTTSHQQLGFCVKCDCNGHSNTCNPDTGECFCEHNTIGESCERCAPGYYGNPLLGSPGDCKKCACPLEEEENNFSPSCQLDSSSLSNDDDEPGYVCTQCPRGYTGDHCEICDDGYFGIPSKLGGKCEPCSCGGGPCDRITGQCLGCRGNTEGWRCERCKPGYFGDPVIGCEACLCDPQGSIKPDCNNVTGECECKEHFIGRTCNKCEVGYGNVTAHCTPCICNAVGSKSNICDPHSGLCECHPGVEGFHCDACQHLHYGFSESGCQSCNCNPRGSELKTCDIVTGQCRCKPFYTSRTCNVCLNGYWDSPGGCIKCECDLDGSSSENCDQRNGNCHCKPGIEGRNCDTCKPGHYGFSKTGCKECDVCNKNGHICDPDTGRCVCPPHSHGTGCSVCKVNTWGYEPNQGCKLCGCSDTGSIKMQCNAFTGECMCQQGYTGHKCNKCVHGYYGYPKCRRCSCNVAGTDKIKGKCDSNGICQCHSDGTCPCKINVSGKRCVSCKDGTFDLDNDNPDGCTKCFCFGRSTLCTGSSFTWGKIRAQNRTMEIDFMDKGSIKNKKVRSNDIIDISNFEEIEGTTGNVKKFHDHFDIPLYWKLPANFIKDHILSYGGYLRFSTSTEEPIDMENDLFKQYPLVRIEGNNFKLISFPLALNNKYEIRLHESLWQRINANDSIVSRELLMITLQNITGIYIKATDYSKFSKVILSDVSLDSAIKVLGNPPPMAKGVEKCVCSKEYNGTSCQNPNRGYFRQKADNPPVHGNILNNIDAIIGKSVKCQCNNRSEVCDIETGECLNCNANTAGKLCEHCAEGYYGDPMNGKCMACACPSITQNFAVSCTPIPRLKKFECVCKKGYEGSSCEKCSASYYRDRTSSDRKCIPCNCNIHGSISDECDEDGSCICKPGITGQTCSQCEKSRHILENNYCIPCDNCTQLLLDDIENLTKHLDDNTIHLQNGVVAPPWKKLTEIENRYMKISTDVVEYLDNQDELKSKVDLYVIKQLENETFIIKKNLDNKENELKHILKMNEENRIRADSMSKDLKKTKNDLDMLIKSLNNFGKSTISTEDAVQQGQHALKEINEFYKQLECLQPPKDVVTKCNELKTSIQKLMNEFKFTDTKKLKKAILKLKEKYLELEDILAGIDVKNQKVMKRNKDNKNKYLEIKKKLDGLKTDHEILKQHLNETKKLIDDTIDMLNKIEMNYEEFLRIRDQNEELLQQVEEKASILEESIITLENYKGSIDEHADKLNKSVSNYINQFHLSTKELDAVNASRRYKEILEIFNAANKTVMEAEEDFSSISKTTLEPITGDSIYDNSSISKADSDRLLKRIDNLNSQITGFSERLNKLYSQIEDIKGHNWKNGITNNGLLERLNQLAAYSKNKIGDFKTIESKIRIAVQASDQMRKVYKDAVNINISKKYNLDKNYLKLLNLTSSENVRKFQDDIKLTKEILHDISKYGTRTNIDVIREMNKGTASFDKEKGSLEKKLEALRASIKKSEQIAAYIRVPLSGSNCARSYKIENLEPTTVMKIHMDFTSNDQDGDLFYLSNGQQYINLKKDNGEIKFWYKFSNESYLSAKINDNQSISITIERSNNKIELLINDVRNDIKDQDSTLFNVSTYNLLYVGKSSKDIITGIPGCIKDITINGYRLGFWKFADTSGECSGCNRNNTIRSSNKYKFNGNGYISDNITSRTMNPSQINIKMNMKTFDENSLLFLAYYENNYMALIIRNGSVSCEIHYSNNKINPIIVKSKEKHNNNQKVSLDCTKQFNKKEGDHVRFNINQKPVSDDVLRNVLSNDILKIKKATLYYGGVPPDFGNKEFIDKSFLGILEEVSFTGSSLSLQDNRQFYGVDLYDTDKDISYHQVLFDQPGYLHLSITNEQIKTISFILRTELENAFVLRAENVEFHVQHGKIVANYGEYGIESDVQVNNDEYNQIELVLNNKQMSLLVNGNEEGNVNVKFDKRDEKSKKMLVYIGGRMGHVNKFEGVIKDIFINNKLLDITTETYLDSLGAKIGRSKPIKKRHVDVSDTRHETVNMDMKDMQQTDACDKVNYSLEPNAVKFGDAANSYIQHFMKDNQRKNNFSIEFEFRTFYKNGLLYFMQGPRENYNLIEVREGKLAIVIGAKQTNYFIIGSRIDDGNWHHVSIHYVVGKVKKAKITIAIDGEMKRHNIRQKKIGGKLYLGDIPKSSWSNLPQTAKSQPFRGCMRSIKINGSPLGLIHNKNTVLNNIGQCFPNIELGSYFRGDSFAIYKNEFPLKNFLEVSFEFRTSEQNGILLSVSHPDNNPALSIELQNGEVVMSVDMGNGIISNVTSKLAKYIICNNKWHHIRAIFSTELTVIVDRVGNSWVLSEIGFEEQIEEPLYIGGLPDTAAGGTLKIKENFKGCIRNLLINNEQIDWINMYDLNNVSLNSCPVIL